jgi:hypothetical protein
VGAETYGDLANFVNKLIDLPSSRHTDHIAVNRLGSLLSEDEPTFSLIRDDAGELVWSPPRHEFVRLGYTIPTLETRMLPFRARRLEANLAESMLNVVNVNMQTIY